MHAVTLKHFNTLAYFKSVVTNLVKWSSLCHNDTEFTFPCSILEKKKRKEKGKGRKEKKEDNVTSEIITGTRTVNQIHEICIDQRVINQHTMCTVLLEFSVSDFIILHLKLFTAHLEKLFDSS